MNPVVALVGRPNVGKSTLFNVLTKTRDAIVADFSGLTRDRQYGTGKLGPYPFVVIDTGGFIDQASGLDAATVEQSLQAIEEADLLLFMVAAPDGITAADQILLRAIRRSGKPVLLVINKMDGQQESQAVADFAELGLADMVCTSAAHRRGLQDLMERMWQSLGVDDLDQSPAASPQTQPPDGKTLTIIGRPNVGKSTLVNRLLHEDRMVVSDVAGTTRDSVATEMEWQGEKYTLIDTAGVRRKSKVHERVEKFSIVKTLDALAQAQIAIIMIDAREGITEQDLSLLGLALEQGRAAVLAVNKWDGLDKETRNQVRVGIDRRLTFADYLDIVFISALRGSGLGELMQAVDRAYQSATLDISTSKLTNILTEATQRHAPAAKLGRVAKLRYAHLGGLNPPCIVIHGTRTDTVAEAYKRYLANHFIKRLKIRGTPVSIELRSGDNPYKGRKNKLTARQLQKRKRLKKFTKRR